MYVKFPYVRGPGFYGTGLLNILGNSSAAMTAAWREALDAGTFASEQQRQGRPMIGQVLASFANCLLTSCWHRQQTRVRFDRFARVSSR